MKILHFHRYLGAGGIEAMVCGLVNEMAKTEDVTVCTIFRPYKNDIFYNKLSPLVTTATINKHDERPPFKEMFKIVRFIRKGRYDVVHIHGFFYYYALAVLLLHNRTHFFYTIHSDALKENTSWDLKLLKLKRIFFHRNWMRPITISPVSSDSFFLLYNCESRMILNGIPFPDIEEEPALIRRVKVTSKTKVFISAGRISPEKNHIMLCKVFHKLIDAGWDVALIIAGPNYSEQIMTNIRCYFSERIIYVDQQPNIPSFMASVDAMCMTSIYEGLPIVLLEALSVGCVPICTPVGGIINVVESGRNGILSSEVSECSYYDAVSQFLNMSDSEVLSMKKRCKDSFALYDISITAQKYIDYYNEILTKVRTA